MEYQQPKGCKAAVSSNWEYTDETYKLTARMVCGGRNNIVEGSFTRQPFNFGARYESEQTEERVGKDVTETLGAMCLGCPHNELTGDAVEATTKTED